MNKKLHECSWSFLRATKLVDKKPTRRFTSKIASESNERLAEARAMPESRGPPLLGMMSWLMSSAGGTQLHEYVDRKHKELGPVYKDCVGPVKAIFVNSPDEYRRIFRLEGQTPKHYLPEAFYVYNQMRNCKRGLLFMDGEEWLHFRRILNKILLIPDPDKAMGAPCQIIAELFVKRLSDYADKDLVIPNLEDLLYQSSIEVMLGILMGPTAWIENSKKLETEAKKLSIILHNLFFYSVRLSSLPTKLAVKLNLPWWTKFVKCLDDAMDILKILIPEMCQNAGDGILKNMMSEGIRDEDLFRIVADLIIAAGDTTAYSMQWSLFLIASNPNQQEKLYERVKDLNRYETLRDQLMKGVVKESLRLYPTAPFITRFLPEDNILLGYKVCKDELIIMSLYSSSRDPANFVKPNEFLPERWVRNETGDLENVSVPHATLPFAMGGRSCIGRKLAETQLVLTISELIKNYRLTCVNKDRVKLKLHLISVPSEPILISLSKR